MKVVMLGPSGAGKTTLAIALAKGWGTIEHIEKSRGNITHIENSAGLIMTKEGKKRLDEKWGHDTDSGEGQVGVINRSSKYPEFGVEFQEWVYHSRKTLIEDNDNIVLDRSLLDPVVFWLNQVVHNVSYEQTDAFLIKCFHAMFESGVTHLIRVPLLNPTEEISTDGGRCSNWYFQKKIDLICDQVMVWFTEFRNQYLLEHPHRQQIRVHYVNTWDLKERTNKALQFLNQNTI